MCAAQQFLLEADCQTRRWIANTSANESYAYSETTLMSEFKTQKTYV